ncbi:MAG: hypothetical protein JJ934_18180, partial [Pseudomonadales bacterium]|nr:hypothetical protein [Pseudomonadales bacterium]
MRLGALLGPVDPTHPNGLATQARQLEGEGYDSLWSAQAMGRGFMVTDPFIALTAGENATEIEIRKKDAASWFQSLRDQICASFESIEDDNAGP